MTAQEIKNKARAIAKIKGILPPWNLDEAIEIVATHSQRRQG